MMVLQMWLRFSLSSLSSHRHFCRWNGWHQRVSLTICTPLLVTFGPTASCSGKSSLWVMFPVRAKLLHLFHNAWAIIDCGLIRDSADAPKQQHHLVWVNCANSVWLIGIRDVAAETNIMIYESMSFVIDDTTLLTLCAYCPSVLQVTARTRGCRWAQHFIGWFKRATGWAGQSLLPLRCECIAVREGFVI